MFCRWSRSLLQHRLASLASQGIQAEGCGVLKNQTVAYELQLPIPPLRNVHTSPRPSACSSSSSRSTVTLQARLLSGLSQARSATSSLPQIVIHPSVILATLNHENQTPETISQNLATVPNQLGPGTSIQGSTKHLASFSACATCPLAGSSRWEHHLSSCAHRCHHVRCTDQDPPH